MAIKGSLREASFPDVLQLLAMGQKTGCLSVSHRQHFGYVYFDRGRISYASIVNRRDRLGDLLVKHGLVAREQLEQAIAIQAASPERRLGEILVSSNLIAREELHRYIRVQIEEAVYFLFTWNQGTFAFEADVRPDEHDLVVSINPESLLLEGARRVDEWSLIEKKVPSFDVIFDIERERLAAANLELTDEQRRLVDLVDGRRDVSALVDESGLGEFETGKALYGLASAGFLHRVGRTRPVEAVVSEARIAEHRNLGIAFYKAGMLDEAVREFRRVAELRPGDDLAVFYAGLVLLRQARWAEAAQVFQQAAVRPGAPRAVHHNLAYALERLGKLGEARAALEQAGGEPVDPRTRLSAAVLHVRGGELSEAARALEDCAQLLGSRPRPAAWYLFAAHVAVRMGDLERGVAVLSEGVGTHPHSAVLLNNLAVVLERRGLHADATQAAERGVLEDATLPQLHKNLGDLHYRAGRYEDALEAYQRAVRHDPALGGDVYLKLGNIRYRRQEREEAMRCWERSLELAPENAIARSNLETLRRSA